MNIFATSMDPVDSALALDDRRINKMISETCQMLSFVMWRKFAPSGQMHLDGFHKVVDKRDRLLAFTKHPCTMWAGRSRENLQWLIDHGIAMYGIFEDVYGIKKPDGTQKHALNYSILMEADSRTDQFLSSGLQPFQNCTEYKSIPEIGNLTTVELYRKFMLLKWNKRDKKPPTWRNRPKPEWYEKYE